MDTQSNKSRIEEEAEKKPLDFAAGKAMQLTQRQKGKIAKRNKKVARLIGAFRKAFYALPKAIQGKMLIILGTECGLFKIDSAQVEDIKMTKPPDSFETSEAKLEEKPAPQKGA